MDLFGPRASSDNDNPFVLAVQCFEKKAMRTDYVWWFPDSDPCLVQTAYVAFEEALQSWCTADIPSEIDFHNMMFAILCHSDEPEMKMARLFGQWIEQRFHDCWPVDLDPDRAALLEAAHMSMFEDLPTWTMRREMKRLTQLWLHVPPDHLPPAGPAEPQVRRPYNRTHEMFQIFTVMQSAEVSRLLLRAVSRPIPRAEH